MPYLAKKQQLKNAWTEHRPWHVETADFEGESPHIRSLARCGLLDRDGFKPLILTKEKIGRGGRI
jgi:hypothetical protein